MSVGNSSNGTSGARAPPGGAGVVLRVRPVTLGWGSASTPESEQAQVEHRPGQQPGVLEKQRDEQPPDPAVPIEVRIDRFECTCSNPARTSAGSVSSAWRYELPAVPPRVSRVISEIAVVNGLRSCLWLAPGIGNQPICQPSGLDLRVSVS